MIFVCGRVEKQTLYCVQDDKQELRSDITLTVFVYTRSATRMRYR
jgi:hypothetical protein